MKKLSLTLVFIAFIISCKSQDYNVVGEKFDHSNSLSIEEAVENISKENVAIKATVGSVCQVKGCWMTLKNESSGFEIFVKFKDYGFFMPLDLAGKQIVAHGMLSKATTSIKELQHYAEDAGKSKAEIDKIIEPKEEYKMMADGVVILK